MTLKALAPKAYSLYTSHMKVLKLPLWLHFILIVVFFTSGLISMQKNSIKVKDLREQIVLNDQNADDKAVDKLINELAVFVRSHTNTQLRVSGRVNEPPVQLIGRYERAVKSANEAVSKNPAFDNKLYLSALSECSVSGISSYSVVAVCIEQYLKTRAGTGDAPNVPVLPRKELYTYDFASPTLGADLPGFLIVTSVFLGVWWVIRFVGWRVQRYLRS
jgi:hypothetical protein